MASAGEFVKFSLQCASHRAGLSVADGAEIDLAQPNHFSGSAADEYFVRNIELVARNRLLDYGVTEVVCQRDQTIASNAFEYRCARRGVNYVVTHHENIFAGTLGHVALGSSMMASSKPARWDSVLARIEPT